MWLKPLKFLGLEYDGNTNVLRSRTRKGKTLIYDKEKMLREMNRRDLNLHPNDENYTESKNTFYEFTRSKYIGFVTSRLFNGSWNQTKL